MTSVIGWAGVRLGVAMFSQYGPRALMEQRYSYDGI